MERVRKGRRLKIRKKRKETEEEFKKDRVKDWRSSRWEKEGI